MIRGPTGGMIEGDGFRVSVGQPWKRLGDGLGAVVLIEIDCAGLENELSLELSPEQAGALARLLRKWSTTAAGDGAGA